MAQNSGIGQFYQPTQGGETPLGAQQKWEGAIMGLKEQGLAQEKADYQTMLENIKSNPINVLMEANMTRQAEALNKYQEDWTDVYVKQRGKLTPQQEIKMNTDKMSLLQMQAKIKQDEMEYLDAYKTIGKDLKGDYDKDYFQQAQAEMFRTGQAPAGGFLTPAGYKDLNIQIAKLPEVGKISDVTVPYTDKQGNVTSVKRSVYDEEKQREFLNTFITSDQRALKTVVNEFSDLDGVKQKEYIDKAGGDQLKAILDYTWDSKGHLLKRDEMKSVTKPPSSRGGYMIFGFGGSENNPKTIKPQSQVIAGKKFNAFIPFAALGTSDRTVDGSVLNDLQVIEDGKLVSVPSDRYADYNVTGYDADSKLVFLRKKLVGGTYEQRPYAISVAGGRNTNLIQDVLNVESLGLEKPASGGVDLGF